MTYGAILGARIARAQTAADNVFRSIRTGVIDENVPLEAECASLESVVQYVRLALKLLATHIQGQLGVVVRVPILKPAGDASRPPAFESPQVRAMHSHSRIRTLLTSLQRDMEALERKLGGTGARHPQDLVDSLSAHAIEYLTELARLDAIRREQAEEKPDAET